jgi:hypothetical protein
LAISKFPFLPLSVSIIRYLALWSLVNY